MDNEEEEETALTALGVLNSRVRCEVKTYYILSEAFLESKAFS